jgi:hypothetical protein
LLLFIKCLKDLLSMIVLISLTKLECPVLVVLIPLLVLLNFKNAYSPPPPLGDIKGLSDCDELVAF